MGSYRIGYDMTILWAINDRAGAALPLTGKEVHLYYTCERGRYEAEIEVQDNVVIWNFLAKKQRYLGGYALTIEILQSDGKRAIRKDINDAFSLVSKTYFESPDEGDANISEGGLLTLSSELDIYRISPIIPQIGANGNWFVDGTDTGKPSTGKSAYEYAQEKGYEGTESEYAELLKQAPENSAKLTELSEELTELSGEILVLSEGKEDKSNKTTTLSSASTDTQYPSAKAVYEALQKIEAGGSIDPELLEGYMPLSRDFSDDFNNDFAR